MTMRIEPRRLRALRLAKFFSLRDLAEQADLNYMTIHRLEQGKQQATLRTIRRLAQALGVEPSQLVEGT